MSKQKFCHLHLHDEYSKLDGYGTAEQYVSRAKELEFEYLALTNHGNIDGLIKFQKECDKQGIKPVLGCEIYIVPDPSKKVKGDKRGHATLLVKNQTGWENLCMMLTNANLNGFYYKPRVGFKDLLDKLEGLVIMTGCVESFLNLYGGIELFEDLIRDGADIYLEVMPHDIPMQSEMNDICARLADKYGIGLVATNDCHYVEKDDSKVQDVLLAIGTKSKMSDERRFRFSFDGLHLRTMDEMTSAFMDQLVLTKKEIKEALLNTVDIAKDCCDFRIKKQDIYLPVVPGYEDKNIEAFLITLAKDRLDILIDSEQKSLYKRYHERLMDEWQVIKEKRFVGYFMIVWELINWCKKTNIMTGPGRGSVGGSLLAYLLGITTVDPIKYDLLFSRFISEERIDYPDIDIDFEDRKRHLIREHLEELYGQSKIASISTFLTMKGRGAIRDTARVFDVPLESVDAFAKVIDSASQTNEGEKVIEVAARDTVEGQMFSKQYPEVVDMAIKLEGQVRGAGQHAAAIVVSADDLTKGTRGNLAVRSGMVVSNWDMEDSEFVGLMKLDVLGLNTLSILNETKRLVKENHNVDIDFASLEPTDKKIYKELAQGNTVGVFQINTWAGTKMCKEVEIDDFEMLSDVLALVRPGPSDSGMTQDYIDRHHGKKWKKKHKEYEKIVKDTYGIIIYQEQVMQVIHKIAGLPYATADKIRKIIGKKRDVREFAQYKDAFIQGCLAQKTFDENEAEEFWTALEAHANYSFNKSHSVEYAMISYWTAWCKVYYPTEFICASLSYGPESKKEELVKEAVRLGLKVVLPKIGKSDSEKWVVKDGALYVPFLEVKGVGEKGAAQCVSTNAKSSKKRVEAFFERDKPSSITGKLDRILKNIGAYGTKATTGDLQAYFTFNISGLDDGDSTTRYKRLYALVGDRQESLDDLTSLNFVAKRLGFIQKGVGYRNMKLENCTYCKLVDECTGPVLPSKGKYNVMICGEAPGKDEDDQGKGFVGRSGEALWAELDKYGYDRKLFHVTNIVKCYPRDTRTPNKCHIESCKPWLMDEINNLRPRLILAFGNTSLKCLIGKESGIMDKSGKIEWVEDIGAWVVWSIHPSAVLHNPNNKQLLSDSIKKFVGIIEEMGGMK